MLWLWTSSMMRTKPGSTWMTILWCVIVTWSGSRGQLKYHHPLQGMIKHRLVYRSFIASKKPTTQARGSSSLSLNPHTFFWKLLMHLSFVSKKYRWQSSKKKCRLEFNFQSQTFQYGSTFESLKHLS